MHDVVDPVAGSTISDDAAYPSENKSLANGRRDEIGKRIAFCKQLGRIGFAGAENAVNERSNADP